MNLSNFSNMDSNILLSIINMKLRDEFDSLDDLVRFYDIDRAELVAKLKSAGFEYHAEHHQFR